MLVAEAFQPLVSDSQVRPITCQAQEGASSARTHVNNMNMNELKNLCSLLHNDIIPMGSLNSLLVPFQKGLLFYKVKCDLYNKTVQTVLYTEDPSKLVIFMMQISEQNEPINQISNS